MPKEETNRFNLVYEATFLEMKRFVTIRCAEPSFLPDLLQEIYLEYYKILSDKGIGYVKDDRALLFQIAKRKCFRYYSLKQKLLLLVPLFQTNEDGEEYCVTDLYENGAEGTAPGVEESVLTAVEAERITAMLSEYPAKVRKILTLFYVEGLSHAQIAKVMGCSLSNVKNKLYRTIAEIRRREMEQNGRKNDE